MSQPPSPGPTAEAPTLATVARWVVILVGTFFLLRELGPILKPLLLAVLLGYVILPFHLAVKRRVPGRLSLVVSAVLSLILIVLLTIGIQATIRALVAEAPTLIDKTEERFEIWQKELKERYPDTWKAMSDLAFPERSGAAPVRELTSWLVGVAADTLTTAAVVGLYLLFLLWEAGRFPDRVRKAFSEPRAERILETIAGVNRGIGHYLTAKVKSSLILAVPVFVVLFVFRVPLAVAWAALSFFCNFIPYLGSLVGYTVPTLFVLYTFGPGWETITIAILLLAIHLVSASIVEPAVIGRAVGLSPVVILLSLAFWGYCWGLTGMLLAVPLTVMLKITCEHMDATRPLAKLVSDE
jgi:AI-2 transport protein TqsA